MKNFTKSLREVAAESNQDLIITFPGVIVPGPIFV